MAGKFFRCYAKVSNNKKIMLAKVQGELFAVSDTCPHDDISLSLGCLASKTIRCSLHGAIFDLETGQVLKGPAEENLTSYKLRIKNKNIQVQI